MTLIKFLEHGFAGIKGSLGLACPGEAITLEQARFLSGRQRQMIYPVQGLFSLA